MSESLYAMGGGHGKGDDHHQAYVIDTGDDHGGDEAAEEGPDLATLYAAADEASGAKVFGKCKACHKLEKGENATGPYLYGVVGRDVGTADGFAYSGAMQAVAQVWGVEELNAFLENPKGFAPGTKMAFSGLKKAEDRADVILYLDLLDGDRVELASAPAEEAAAEPAAEEAATEEAAAEEPAAEEAASADAAGFAAVVAAADADKGKKVFNKCKACHKLEDGKNGVGPHLYGVVGRAVDSVDGFRYSGSLSAVAETWTADTLNAFLENPKGFAPGTKMAFAGLKKEEDRANVIAYLESVAN
ncbi:cytochrome c family protein [Roseovarius faecimaris]|uniref:c-type cytochrome n=1 Tax=Roseovarius faecimaris TaxID=2494550 RepID=UPI0031B57F6A